MGALTDRPAVASFDRYSSYVWIADFSEPLVDDQDKRTRIDDGILEALASTRKLLGASTSSGAISFDADNRIDIAYQTTLTENISPGGISVSNVLAATHVRVFWFVTASGTDRIIPVTAFPAGSLIEGNWDETIPVGTTRAIRLETLDGGTNWRVVSNSPIAIFSGPGALGVVPDPTSVSGKVLLDDGTWTATLPQTMIATSGDVDSSAAITLSDADHGKTLILNNGGAVTLTVPNTLTVGFACSIICVDATTVTFSVADTRHPSTGGLSGDGKAAWINRYSTNDVVIVGPLA